ncbi:MAG: PepSY domain-containing protein, partial [Methylocella sp.]
HMARVFGRPYQIFVCVLGLATTMLPVTGVYIWWKKRSARKFSEARCGETAEANSGEARSQ